MAYGLYLRCDAFDSCDEKVCGEEDLRLLLHRDCIYIPYGEGAKTDLDLLAASKGWHHQATGWLCPSCKRREWDAQQAREKTAPAIPD